MRNGGSGRGQATPLVAVVVVLAAMVVVLIGRLGSVAVDNASAQAAADTVALAGAVHGRVGAERVAAANQSTIVDWKAAGAEVEVVVERHGVRARARARGEP